LFTLAVLDCLWNDILGNKKNEIWFLENEGMYVLLEFLETCDDLQRKMSLSCLSNLIENPKAINYFCNWNSTKTVINATQLLIKLYDKEDIKYHVKYRDGILEDVDRPLNPKTRKSRDDIPQGILGSSKVNSRQSGDIPIVSDRDDILDSINKNGRNGLKSETLERIKGFARLKEALKAGESDTSAGTEAYLVKKLREKAEEYDLRSIIFSVLYRTGFDRHELNPQEKQRLEVIKLYPNFKMGEIWNDIKFDLETERLKPTSDDYHWMMTNIEEIEDLILGCVATQTLIAKECKKAQEEDLNRFYDIIRSNKLNK